MWQAEWLPRFCTQNASAKLHKFAVIVVAGDVEPGRPHRGRLQHVLMQLSTSVSKDDL
jgi:hypothetical protein